MTSVWSELLQSKAMDGHACEKDGSSTGADDSGTNRPTALPAKEVVDADVDEERNDDIGRRTPSQEPGRTRTCRFPKHNRKEVSFTVPSISLSRKEIEDDLLAMTGSKPTKRPKSTQKNFDVRVYVLLSDYGSMGHELFFVSLITEAVPRLMFVNNDDGSVTPRGVFD